MAFLQLGMDIGTLPPEPFEEALLAAGALSITLQDAGDDPVLEPLPGATPLWPQVHLQALFEAQRDPAELRGIIAAVRHRLRAAAKTPADAAAIGAASLAPRFEVLEDRLWEREWLKDFRPMRFGRRLWICPGGQRPAQQEPAAPPCVVELDPGLAFGTGTHPTTALCLAWLDAAELQERRIIDYGCGSGVLAIAALKLGARSAVAIDIDHQALQATTDNARRNAVQQRLSVHLAGSAAVAPADILLANILAEPLQALAASFAQLLLPGGKLVLSGILRSQAAAVAHCYAPWFDIEAPRTTAALEDARARQQIAAPGDAASLDQDPWVRLDGTRRCRTSAC